MNTEYKPKKIDALNERSEQVQEILGTPPRWPVVFGSTLMFVVLCFLVLLSFLIKYPDQIHSRIIITTQAPPVGLVAKASGKLKIEAPSQSEVKANDLLCTIENAANPKDIRTIRNVLDNLGKSGTFVPKLERLALGEVQDDYNHLLQAYERLNLHLRQSPLRAELTMVLKQIDQQKMLLARHVAASNTLAKRLKLFEGDYLRHQQLYNQKVIAASALEEKEEEVLGVRSVYENAVIGTENSRARLLELQSQASRLTVQETKESADARSACNVAVNKLRTSIAVWEQKYLVISPIRGKVAFVRYWSDNQFIKEGEEVAVVIPRTGGKVVGRVKMPIGNSGKVKTGQRVNIYLDNYPSEEFGVLVGYVVHLSPVPRDDAYVIDVSFSKGLRTTYNKVLPFRQEMQGKAEIIVEDASLFERIFYQLRKIFN